MKSKVLILILILTWAKAEAQKIYTKNGSISFFSSTPVENIDAKNNQVLSVLNTQTGELQFSVLIRAFDFRKALMEEHFNENYLESNKFPKATFKGKINEIAKINFSIDGSYNVTVDGALTMHGVTNKLKAFGNISIKSGVATAFSKFNVRLKDYGITIPKIVRNNISETIETTVKMVYDQKM